MSERPSFPNSHHHVNQAESIKTACEEVLALIPSYSVGATNADETRLVESMLPFCAKARTELDEYRAITDSLLHLAPAKGTPPPVQGLLERVVAYERSLEEGTVSTHNRDRTPPPVSRFTQEAVQPLVNDLGTMPDLRLVAREEPPVQSDRRSDRRNDRRLWWLGAVAAAVALVLLGVNVYWTMQFSRYQRDQQRILESLVTRLEQPTTVTDLSGVNYHRVLNANVSLPGELVGSAQGIFTWDAVPGTIGQVGAVVVNGLPALENEQTYQLWLVRDGHSLSLGTFEVDPNGAGTLIFRASERIEDFSHIGVSIEPRGGSTNPTTPHLVIGDI
ncbi:MAG: anti-sigma factor [bacterium]|nr:anti-sigma factor [bacterium]